MPNRYNEPTMNKRTRERIALVVFLLLGFAVAVALMSYFSTGRSWNVAASVVDDTVGRMDGYTAIAYAGTTPSVDESVDLAPATSAFEEAAPTAADSLGLSILSILPPLPSEEERGVYVSDVRDLYEGKEAQVVSLDTSAAHRYAQPTVLYAGSKRVGVFSVSSYTTEARINEIVEGLLERNAEILVCITPRPVYLAALDALDVVISTTAEEGTSLRGADVDGAFVVQAPPQGTVGLVVVSQANVPSAKVVEAL